MSTRSDNVNVTFVGMNAAKSLQDMHLFKGRTPIRGDMTIWLILGKARMTTTVRSMVDPLDRRAIDFDLG